MEKMRSNIEMSAKRLQRVEKIVGGIENQTKKILTELTPKIEAGQYQMILGVDASGRLPTLVIARVIKGRYGDLNLRPPAVRFLAGGFDDKLSEQQLQEKTLGIDARIKRWIQDGTLNSQRKVLVVEDTVATGGSVKMLTDMLAENNVEFEVAALASALTPEKLSERLGANAVVGQYFAEASTYAKRDVAGVKKRHQDVFASRYEPKGRGPVIVAREQVDQLSNQLLAWYRTKLALES